MLISEKDKLLDAVSKIYENKVDSANIVLVGTFIDIDQKPVDIVRDEDGAIRFIYIDEGSTMLLLKYHNRKDRDLIEEGLEKVKSHLQSQKYKLKFVYEASDTTAKECGEFAFSFCR